LVYTDDMDPANLSRWHPTCTHVIN
jgi:hypothetical protein